MNKRIYYITFIIVFIFIVSSPFWGLYFNKETELTENRIKSKIEDVRGINSLKTYINDNHGFRSLLSNTYMQLYLNFFKESPVPNQVIVGKSDWLFLGDNYNRTFSSAIGVNSVRQSDVNYTLRQVKFIKEYSDSIGCNFYLIIAPNKNSIYSEYLPIKPNNNIPKLRDIITSKLKADNINILDLYPIVRQLKKENILYYKTDTHWNHFTGLMVSKYINDWIRKDIILDSLSAEDFSIKKINTHTGDLASMLNEDLSDEDFEVKSKNRFIIEASIIEENHMPPLGNITYIKNKISKNTSRAIIFRDSFFTAMYYPFLSTINESITIEQRLFDHEKVNQLIKTHGKPDFILYEVVERNLTEIRFK